MPGQADELVHYIRAGGETVAIFTRTDNANPADDRTRYPHRDHLGSIDLVTGETGQALDTRSFDAWGRARNADWTPVGAATIVPLNETKRGFTGHEHLDSVGLIHMNGRVYDPLLGRFLSADPSDALNPGVGLNRYAYVLNNPLSLTDPSGFASVFGPGTPWSRERFDDLEYMKGFRDEVINGNYEVLALAMNYLTMEGLTSRVFFGEELVPSGPLIEPPENPSASYAAGGWTAFGIDLVGGAKAGLEVLKIGIRELSQLARYAQKFTTEFGNSNFSHVEQRIIEEARSMLASPEFVDLQNAYQAGESATVNIAGRSVQYEPGLPASGISNFGEGGFVLGPEAFKSVKELRKTVLHELHRLNTSQQAVEGVYAELVEKETKAAIDFAEEAAEELE